MPNLAKLAKLSKRFKTQEAKTHDDVSAFNAPIGDSDDEPAPAKASAPAVSVAAPVATAGGGAPANVTVNIDLGPVKDMLGRVRDEIRGLRDEMKRVREKGLKIEFGDDSGERLDQMLKHVSSVGKASRELTEKLVTSLPESRWYGDLIKLGREIGETIAVGSIGGGGGNPEEITAIKEALEMQQTQLMAILSMLKKK